MRCKYIGKSDKILVWALMRKCCCDRRPYHCYVKRKLVEHGILDTHWGGVNAWATPISGDVVYWGADKKIVPMVKEVKDKTQFEIEMEMLCDTN